MLRFEIEKSYKSFNDGYRPQIDNYIPESSLEAILDLGNPLFGEPRARIAMLELILERCELKAKPYRLHLLDDFALRADPELASLISNSETILLVGGGEPLASNNDFTCGSFCSRRDRAFRIKWSTSRERVAEARRVFERLGNLSPPARQVTASEIGKAISALKGRIKKRRIS
jgi:hypothetical protein